MWEIDWEWYEEILLEEWHQPLIDFDDTEYYQDKKMSVIEQNLLESIFNN